MTNLEDFEDQLEEPLRSTVNEVLTVIKTKKNDETIAMFSLLDTDFVISFLEERSIPIISSFKEGLTTPFAIAKYLVLLDQQNELHEKLKKLFQSTFNEKEIVWLFPTDLSNRVFFVKNDEHPNSLHVRYWLDKNEKFGFVLDTDSIGWPVTFEQLIAILTCNFESYTQVSDVKTIRKSSEDIVISVGNKTIVIKDN